MDIDVLYVMTFDLIESITRAVDYFPADCARRTIIHHSTILGLQRNGTRP